MLTASGRCEIADGHPIDPEEVDRSAPKPASKARSTALQTRKQRIRHYPLVEVAKAEEEFSPAVQHFVARACTGTVSPYTAIFQWKLRMWNRHIPPPAMATKMWFRAVEISLCRTTWLLPL